MSEGNLPNDRPELDACGFPKIKPLSDLTRDLPVISASARYRAALENYERTVEHWIQTGNEWKKRVDAAAKARDDAKVELDASQHALLMASGGVPGKGKGKAEA